MSRYLNKKAQSTLEYAVIIAVVVGALVAMQFYLKRGLQGRLRQSSDDIGEQFSPILATSNRHTFSNVQSEEEVGSGVTTTKSNQIQTRNVHESVPSLNEESW